MIFRQLTHDDLGCASYLIGDEGAGVAAVVDPGFEIDGYLELARYMGVSIEHIFETHNHADHVSGHGRLAAATGATIHIHRAAAPEYDHEPFEDGAEWQLGGMTSWRQEKQPVERIGRVLLEALAGRAEQDAGLLQRHGAARVIHVVEGGVPKWERLGHPLERSEQPATASA